MILPNVSDFDRQGITPFRFLRSLAPELRGVVVNLHDALKEARICVFRAGDVVLTIEQIARQAWLEPNILTSLLPDVLSAGFMAQDDDGALYSPHLYERILKREERAERNAQADANRQAIAQGIAEGTLPATMTPRQSANMSNGARGGRPRNGETKQQAMARREREKAQAQMQRKMPLVSMISGGKSETQNPIQKTQMGSVLGSSVSIDLETECDINIPSSSTSGETQNPQPKTEPAAYEPRDVQTLAARMLSASGLGDDQVGFAVSFAKSYLGRGVEADLIVRAIAAHKQKMTDNGEFPRRLGVFKAPIERAIAGEEVAQIAIEQTEVLEARPDWQIALDEAFSKAGQVYGKYMREYGDFGRVGREWLQIAMEHGLPQIPWNRDAYLAHFKPTDERAAA